eukprot:5715094-Prymnesium_polylepis.1
MVTAQKPSDRPLSAATYRPVAPISAQRPASAVPGRHGGSLGQHTTVSYGSPVVWLPRGRPFSAKFERPPLTPKMEKEARIGKLRVQLNSGAVLRKADPVQQRRASFERRASIGKNPLSLEAMIEHHQTAEPEFLGHPRQAELFEAINESDVDLLHELLNSGVP